MNIIQKADCMLHPVTVFLRNQKNEALSLIHTSEFSDKDFKTASITMLKEVKENTLAMN